MTQESAFPVTDNNHLLEAGLTKRELFAAMALQGLLANTSVANQGFELSFRKFSVGLARSSVGYADALIAELAKPAGEGG